MSDRKLRVAIDRVKSISLSRDSVLYITKHDKLIVHVLCTKQCYYHTILYPWDMSLHFVWSFMNIFCVQWETNDVLSSLIKKTPQFFFRNKMTKKCKWNSLSLLPDACLHNNDSILSMRFFSLPSRHLQRYTLHSSIKIFNKTYFGRFISWFFFSLLLCFEVACNFFFRQSISFSINWFRIKSRH